MYSTAVQGAGHDRLLADITALVPQIMARAAGYDEACAFPVEDIAALEAANLLTAVLPRCVGGLGLGTGAQGAETLTMVFRLLGRGNLAVGRLFEAHVNALRLVARRGTLEQLRRAAALVHAGALFGLWVTDPPEDALLSTANGYLHGSKAFCSGAGHLGHAVVTLRDSAGAVRLAMLPTAHAVATRLPMQLQGMRAATTGRSTFDGMRIDAGDWIGHPDDYMAEPDFSAGAWRTCAVTCGGLEALLGLTMTQLVARGRDGDPHQRARMGRAWIAQETALLWLQRAAGAAERDAPAPNAVAANAVTEVGFARIAIEDACFVVMQLVERSLGLAAFMQPSAIERVRRDLATYLRQPAADEVLTQAAANVMPRRGFC
jgi:alkylation response protein AidB-like acyl-CoA dehydrogenase